MLLGVASISGVTAGAVMISGRLQPGGTWEHAFCESAFVDEAQPAAARESPAATNPANVQTDTPVPYACLPHRRLPFSPLLSVRPCLFAPRSLPLRRIHLVVPQQVTISVVPTGLNNDRNNNGYIGVSFFPALKCWATVILSLRDEQPLLPLPGRYLAVTRNPQPATRNPRYDSVSTSIA